MYPDAIRYYREAIDENAAFAQAYNNLDIIYFKTGKLDDALIAFNHSIDPDFTDTYYNLSNVLYERENLGQVYLQEGMKAEACEEWSISMVLGDKDGQKAYRQYCQ